MSSPFRGRMNRLKLRFPIYPPNIDNIAGTVSRINAVLRLGSCAPGVGISSWRMIASISDPPITTYPHATTPEIPHCVGLKNPIAVPVRKKKSAAIVMRIARDSSKPNREKKKCNPLTPSEKKKLNPINPRRNAKEVNPTPFR